MSAVIRSADLPGGLDQDVDHPPAHLDHLGDGQLHVGRLTLRATVRLVDQHPGVRQGVALARCARGEQHRGGRRSLTDADRGHVGVDEPHRVVDGEQAVHVATGTVDVDGDVGVGVLALQVQQLGDDQVGDVVVDGRAEEDDAIDEQPRVDVERSLASVGGLDDGWDQHGLRSFDRRSCATVWLQISVLGLHSTRCNLLVALTC